ncbi:hypothetical protein CCACVL1_25794 [Corchorus capsularis]|uniref:Uncharacterized protein n=1 Tax=Corchorus capsularis TaxID=210143 RepID=A0A1R3GH51_COCAP|nr:hypothetical protein CCACVL1_25794 [Corchorus capsularis]
MASGSGLVGSRKSVAMGNAGF